MCKVSRQALAPVELRAYIRQIRTFRYRFRLINGIVAEIKGPSEEKVPLSGALSSAGPGSSARDPDLPREPNRYAREPDLPRGSRIGPPQGEVLDLGELILPPGPADKEVNLLMGGRGGSAA